MFRFSLVWFFHVPVALRDYGKFTVAVSDTVVVSEGGGRPLQPRRASHDRRVMSPLPLPEPDFALASRLFETLAKETRDSAGFTRPSYGKGEQFAHDLIRGTARDIGLDVTTDVAGNLYATLKGARPGEGDVPYRLPSRLGSAGLEISTRRRRSCRNGGARIVAPGRVSAGRRRRGDGDPRRGEHLVSLFLYRIEGRARPVAGRGARNSTRRHRPHAGPTHGRLGCDPDAVRRGVSHFVRQAPRGYVELHIEQARSSSARTFRSPSSPA